MKDPIFLSELEDRREELMDSLVDLRLLADRMATQKLMELMESADPRIALRAAIELFRGGLRAYQTVDLRRRVERVEDNLGMIFSWRK